MMYTSGHLPGDNKALLRLLAHRVIVKYAQHYNLSLILPKHKRVLCTALNTVLNLYGMLDTLMLYKRMSERKNIILIRFYRLLLPSFLYVCERTSTTIPAKHFCSDEKTVYAL